MLVYKGYGIRSSDEIGILYTHDFTHVAPLEFRVSGILYNTPSGRYCFIGSLFYFKPMQVVCLWRTSIGRITLFPTYRSTERDLDERGLPTSAGQLRLRPSEVYLLPLILFSFLESRNDSNCQEIRG